MKGNQDFRSSMHELDHWVDRHRDEMVSFTSKLVRIQTENRPPYGNERFGQLVLHDEMEKTGLETDMYALDDVPGLRDHPAFFGQVDGVPRNYEQRPNLAGKLRGLGGGKSLIISGHIDTVIGSTGSQAHECDCSESDFSGIVRNGKLFGRGAYDMKAGLVCGLYALKAIKTLNIPLRGDVVLESVVDEEYGGANGTLASRLRGYLADVVLCPEPTNMRVCHEHLGWLSYKLTVEGEGGISFSGELVENPLYTMSELVSAIREFEKMYPRQFSSVLEDDTIHLPIYIMQMHAGGVDYCSAIGIPKWATMIVGITTCLGLNAEMVSRAFESFLKQHLETRGMDWKRVRCEHPIRYLYPSSVPTDHLFFHALKKVYGNRQLPEPKLERAGFACDAFISNLYFQTPTVLIGPGGANAHAADEYVYVDDMVELTKRFAALIVEWCS